MPASCGMAACSIVLTCSRDPKQLKSSCFIALESHFNKFMKCIIYIYVIFSMLFDAFQVLCDAT